MTSRSHADNAELDRFLEGKAVTERRIAGSALKFCRVAEGVADLYPGSARRRSGIRPPGRPSSRRRAGA